MSFDRAPVDQIKRATFDPHRVCSELGLMDKATRQPHGYHVLCPAHDENSASCSVTIGPDGTLRVHCFAGCGLSGDIFDLIAATERLDRRRDFRRILEIGAQMARITLPASRGERSYRRPPVKTAPKPKPTDLVFDPIARDILEWCPLEDSPAVVKYLQGRGLYEEAQAAGWGALPADTTPLVAELITRYGKDAVDRCAMVKEGRFHPTCHVLIIPWHGAGPDAPIVTLQRRRLTNHGELPRYLFPAGHPPSVPYGMDLALKTRPETAIVFVEGAVDVLARRILDRRQGCDRVTIGLAGVSHWRAEWARIVRGRRAFIALDADKAGQGKVAEIRDDCFAAGALSVSQLVPTVGKDWSDCVVSGAA